MRTLNFAGNLLDNKIIYSLEKYPDKLCDWKLISANSNITVEYIKAHPHKP